MVNALGGGGGAAGFKHLLEHLGPGIQAWTADMKAHEFKMSPETIGKLEASVEDMLKSKDVAAVEAQRDEVLVQLMKMKKDDAPALV